jgi:hypothetical protein
VHDILNIDALEYPKLQAPNNKQYPNSKLQKIPLAPLLKKGETSMNLQWIFLCYPSNFRPEIKSTAD